MKTGRRGFVRQNLAAGRIADAQKAEVEKVIEGVLARMDHQWLKGQTPDQRKEQMKFYKERYNQ